MGKRSIDPTEEPASVADVAYLVHMAVQEVIIQQYGVSDETIAILNRMTETFDEMARRASGRPQMLLRLLATNMGADPP